MRSRIEAMDDQREVANNSTLVNMINNINFLASNIETKNPLKLALRTFIFDITNINTWKNRYNQRKELL